MKKSILCCLTCIFLDRALFFFNMILNAVVVHCIFFRANKDAIIRPVFSGGKGEPCFIREKAENYECVFNVLSYIDVQ